MKLFLSCALFCLCLNLNAQTNAKATAGNGSISGKVTDAANNPIEYATITIYPAGGQKPVNGAISNARGSFKVDGLSAGLYSVTVDFIGYQATRKDSVLIPADRSS